MTGLADKPSAWEALLGIVVIGRNEAPRLSRCAESLHSFAGPIVYVDSGSTDGSPDIARGAGWDVIELDSNAPHSAARGRNEGFDRLAGLASPPAFVQFVDGDCEIRPEWFEFAVRLMSEQPSIAALCGRVREREPGASVYNRLCDMEWHAPSGDARHCGGVFMCRADTFGQVGGFDPAVVAGEEPELCARLRAAGGRTVRVEREMAVHDSDMRRFGQWWRRAKRGGLAYALGAQRSKDPNARRQILSSLGWGLSLPLGLLACLVGAVWWPVTLWGGAALVLVALAQVLRITRTRVRLGDPMPSALLYGAFCLIGKAAQCAGLVRYLRERFSGQGHRVVEHRELVESAPKAR